MIEFPNVLAISSPGGGKSWSAAVDAINFPGAIFVGDPHKESLAELILDNAGGNILFDRFSDLQHSVRFNFQRASSAKNHDKRKAENNQAAQLFTQIVMRRRGSDIATTPLLEEWLLAAQMLFLNQEKRRSVAMIPYAFRPGTKGFRLLLAGCTDRDIKAKFAALASMTPRALRAEVGSAARVVNAIFRSPYFLARCDGNFDIDSFVRGKGKLILEKGECVDDDAFTTLVGAINLLFIEYAKNRRGRYPPIRIYLDEATNAKTAGKIEEIAAGETRKNGLSWYVMTQYLNFPGGPDGYLQNFKRKEVYRTADYDLARKMATIIASEYPMRGILRTHQIQSLTTEIMNLEPGWRFVIGPGGSNRKEYVQPLDRGWP